VTRLLGCFAYFFRGLGILTWVSGIGAALLLLDLLLPGDTKGALTGVGAVFLAGFPILVGGLVYRMLIGNRRAAMVPGLRFFATGALFLLALSGAALAAFVGTQFENRHPDPWIVGQLAFAAISIYLLLTQWMVMRLATTMGFVVLPFIILGLLVPDGAIAQSLFVPWAWLALAGLGWLWLAIAICRPGTPRRWMSAGRAGPGPASGSQPYGIWPRPLPPLDPSRFATAPGTLMRGRGDHWRDRLTGTLTIVLLIPGMLSAFVVLLGVLSGNPERSRFGEVYIGVSLAFVCILPKAIFGEWPARMRLLWVRVAGDRPALWQRLERSLLQEIMLIVAIHLPVLAGYLALYGAPRDLLYFWLAAAALGTLTSGYAGFLARISGWDFVEQAALFLVIVVTFFLTGVALSNSAEPLTVFLLLPLLLVLALSFRGLARSRFQRMDWCRVRPLRFPRLSA
jgi:hypothetical protein